MISLSNLISKFFNTLEQNLWLLRTVLENITYYLLIIHSRIRTNLMYSLKIRIYMSNYLCQLISVLNRVHILTFSVLSIYNTTPITISMSFLLRPPFGLRSPHPTRFGYLQPLLQYRSCPRSSSFTSAQCFFFFPLPLYSKIRFIFS